MNASWQAYLKLLPGSLKEVAQKYSQTLLEIRLRVGQQTEVVTVSDVFYYNILCTPQEISYVINMASRYSPWSSDSLSQGYITAEGGHRVGVCGTAVTQDNHICGIRNPTSVCIRVARDLNVAGKSLRNIGGSVLIIGAPGTGKTTLLRDMIRLRSNANDGAVGVVDERCEVFPQVNGIPCFPIGKSTDILWGCSKAAGSEMLLRCMTPQTIALDEITSEADCLGLLHICWCGVSVICTAHAKDRDDLLARSVYKPLVNRNVFDWLITMQKDRHYTVERMKICT